VQNEFFFCIDSATFANHQPLTRAVNALALYRMPVVRRHNRQAGRFWRLRRVKYEKRAACRDCGPSDARSGRLLTIEPQQMRKARRFSQLRAVK